MTADGAAPDEDLVTVRLLGLPLDVQMRAQEHGDELTRELTLIAAQLRSDGNTHHLPNTFLNLIQQLTARYSAFTVEQERQLDDAIARGDETIDLTYRVPASVPEAAQALGAMLDEADEFCRSGQHLLTLATPDELVAYRWWFLSQFIDQVAGQAPVAWRDYAGTAAP
jgi:hypothetical protein